MHVSSTLAEAIKSNQLGEYIVRSEEEGGYPFFVNMS